MFSVQMDSTQDVSAHDQCTIVLRYVNDDKVHENLISVAKVEDSSGKSLHTLLGKSLTDAGISLKECVADSFDGAANMSGIYSGVQALMKKENPNHIHIWCYAHVLNLVIGDATSVCSPARSLFKLLSGLYTFFSESYKRMSVWDKKMDSKSGSSKLRKLKQVGQTRWSSKDRALRKLFGSFTDFSEEIFSDLLCILKQVSKSEDFKSTVRSKAKSLYNSLCSFETILAAFTFIRIFDITTPVSKYLQDSNIDILQAWRMTEDATKRIEEISNDFPIIHKTAIKFIENVNEKLSAEQIFISTSCPEKRTHNPLQKFQNQYHKEIFDAVIGSLKKRFASHGELYKQISSFDPRRFKEVKANPENIDLGLIARAIPDINIIELREELVAFASSYNYLKMGLFDKEIESENEIEFGIDSDEEECNESTASRTKKEICKDCVSCAFKILSEFNSCSATYENLYLAYKYLMTLCITQCSCERSFSKLKIVKSRLRNSLKQCNLESLLLIAIERKIAYNLKKDKESIIDCYAKTSKELSEYLLIENN